jgi:hypothetical protein
MPSRCDRCERLDPCYKEKWRKEECKACKRNGLDRKVERRLEGEGSLATAGEIVDELSGIDEWPIDIMGKSTTAPDGSEETKHGKKREKEKTSQYSSSSSSSSSSYYNSYLLYH